MNAYEREIAGWIEKRKQLAASGLSRREVARMGLLATSTGALVGMTCQPRQVLAAGAVAANAGTALPVSARTTPWSEPMPIPPVVKARSLTSLTGGLPDPKQHQFWCSNPGEYAPKKIYQMTAKPFTWKWAPEIAADANNWGYNGIFPGPTIDANYGQPIVVRHVNDLPDPATFKGWAYPGSITHLHNFHTASESDGGPWRYTLKGEFTDHHYCLHRAGFSVPGQVANVDATQDLADGFRGANGRSWVGPDSEFGGDLRETLTSLFYHQHMPGYTASNVYRGLVGFCRVFDSMDNNDETNTRGWQLPSDPYDVPIVLADKRFDADGQLYFDPFTTDGFLGDKFTVNGKIQPYFEVQRRKYRFRFLDAGPSRFYTIVFRASGKTVPMVQITDNGNLLEQPRPINQLEIWVAERSDVIVDFSAMPDGTEVYMSNVLPMRVDGRGPDRTQPLLNPDDPANQLVKIVVRGAVAAKDPSRIPTHFRPFAPVVMPEVAATAHKTFNFNRAGVGWAVNGVNWDPDLDHTDALRLHPTNTIKKNSAELWTLINAGGSWEHPIHIHFEEGQVINRNGVSQLTSRRGLQTGAQRQDIYRMTTGTTLQVFLRFRDYPDPGFTVSPPKSVGDPLNDTGKFDINPGRYVMHCHNVVHEDHAMMTSWSIVP